MHNYRAIILNKKKILNGNKIKLFTDKLGKIETYYKFNIKNINLDKLNLLKANIKIYKNKFYLENYIVENYFLNIRNNYNKSLLAMYLIELVDKTIDFDLPEKKIFNLFINFLSFLDKEENQDKILINLLKFVNYYFFLLGYGNLFEFKGKINYISFKDIIKLNEKIERMFNIQLNSIKIK